VSLAFSSGEHFKVKPQRLQRMRWLPPRGITGMKNKVNQRFDSIAVNMVEREHLEQEYSICATGFALVLNPKRKNTCELLEAAAPCAPGAS
jgi:hypothetical protein